MNITLRRVDGALTINPAVEYLTHYLQFHRRGFKTINYRKVDSYKKELLHSILEDGSVLTLPGFFEKVCKLIIKNKDTFTVVDDRTPIPPIDWETINTINWEAIGSTGLRQAQLDPIAEFLHASQKNNGLVTAAAGFGKTIVQAITCAAYSNLNTILAVPLAEVFKQTADKLQLLFPNRHIGRVGGGFHDISPDITITTYKSLRCCSMEKCQLFLADEVQCTTGEGISSVLCGLSPIRAFGFTATDTGMFNSSEKLMKGLFGERLVHVPYQDAQEADAVVPCSVYMIRMSANNILSASTTEGKISQGIKRCKERNRLIGRACQSVPKDWQTLVFVDHIEDHLMSLYKEMPMGTKFLHRGSDKSLGSFALSPSQQKETTAAFKKGEFQYLIATDAFRAGVDIPNCKVVVQASGGTSDVELIQEACRGSRIAPGKTHFVLIDFMDCHDDTLQAMSEKRKAIYQRQGWLVKEVDRIEEIDWHHFEQDPQ